MIAVILHGYKQGFKNILTLISDARDQVAMGREPNLNVGMNQLRL
ncbi:hypothetical protein [Endozoicomonas sp. ALC020]